MTGAPEQPREADSGPPDERVDARGKLCPEPVIDLARTAARLGSGHVIEVWADDPAARTDIPAWCRMRGATLIESCSQGEAVTRFRVRT